MRKMKRSDVHEWIPGEPLERVDFGNGVTGMDKSIPEESGTVGDFKRLIWKCRVIEADGGPCLDVLPSEYWIDDVKQDGYFDVVTCTSNSGPYRFDEAWTYLDGIEKGWCLARRKRHSGLYATLRTLRNGIFGSSAHRHRTGTVDGVFDGFGWHEVVGQPRQRSECRLIQWRDRLYMHVPRPLDTDAPDRPANPFRVGKRRPVMIGALHGGLFLQSGRLSLQAVQLLVQELDVVLAFLVLLHRAPVLDDPTIVTKSVKTNAASSTPCCESQPVMKMILRRIK